MDCNIQNYIDSDHLHADLSQNENHPIPPADSSLAPQKHFDY